MSTILINHMNDERAAMEAFLLLLEQESEALINGNFSALPDLTERKAELADRIAVLDQAREAKLQEFGFPLSREGADAAAAGSPSLQQAWHALLAIAAKSRDSNNRNGVLIHTHLDFNRQTINFLRSSGESLYGPDGQHRVGRGNGKSLASG